MTISRKTVTSLVLAACLSFGASHRSQARPLDLKDGDLWVMAGDSITAQKLHSNYIEAFFRTRYPGLRLHFRNSGVSGDRAANVLKRFDYDVAAWKPRIVSFELGMNDTAGAASLEVYVTDMKALVDKTRELKAMPILISSSPVNDGSMIGNWMSERCKRIDTWANALVELGKKEDVPTVNQFGQLVNIWGANRLLLDAANLAERIRGYKPDGKSSGLTDLQAFAKKWAAQPGGINLSGDNVHPGPVGQYTMAAVILKGLEADPEVSSATIEADGSVKEARHCKISDVARSGTQLSFTRLDERSPWPLEANAGKEALKLMPEIADLSRYLLTIPGLPAGEYQITMDGIQVATVNSQMLAKGVNLGTVTDGPLNTRGTRVYQLIGKLHSYLEPAWRMASKEGNQTKMAEVQGEIEKLEEELQTACQPQAIHFQVTAKADSPAHEK